MIEANGSKALEMFMDSMVHLYKYPLFRDPFRRCSIVDFLNCIYGNLRVSFYENIWALIEFKQLQKMFQRH